MSFLVVQSIRLGQETKQALKEHGGILARADRTTQGVLDLVNEDTEFILNLGSSSFDPQTSPVPVYNRGRDIAPLLWPGSTRELLDELLPPHPETFPCDTWIKAPGYGGRNKFFKQIRKPLILPDAWDYQKHIDGTEYRVVTVGSSRVQQFLREGSNGDRRYTWLPMRELPLSIKEVVKTASAIMPWNTVIAWDTIMTEEQAFILEGNTAPGMNSSTVQRVTDFIRE